MVVNRAKHAVGHGDERQESDEHAADVEREVEAVARALGGGVDDVDGGLLDLDVDLAGGGGLAGFGDEDLGQHDGGWSGHDDGGEQVSDADARDLDVGGHHRAGNMRHAAGHDGEELRLRHTRDERLDGEGRFRLPHEDAGGDVQRFGAAHAHHLLHADRHGAYDPLHHAEVIKNGEERRDEDDDGEDLKREDDAVRAGLDAKRSEEELAAGFGVIEHRAHARADELENLAEVSLENEYREQELQAHAPGDEPELDSALMGGTQPGDSQDDEEAQQSSVAAHPRLAYDFENEFALIGLVGGDAEGVLDAVGGFFHAIFLG